MHYVNICDIQRVKYCRNTTFCGCYVMSTNGMSFVIKHAISVQTVQCGRFQMDEYSLLKYSKLYLNKYIPWLCKLYMLKITKYSMIMFSAMEDCVDLTNNNGGLTIIGWYKRGVINDKSIISACNIRNSGSSCGNPHFNIT